MQSPIHRELEIALLHEVAHDRAHEELDVLSPPLQEQNEVDQHTNNFDFLADALELLPGTARNQGEFMGVTSLGAVHRIQEVCLWVKSKRIITQAEEKSRFGENSGRYMDFFAPYYIIGEKAEKGSFLKGGRDGRWSILLATASPGRSNFFLLYSLKDNQQEAKKVVEQQREQPFTTLGHEPWEGLGGEPGTLAATANLPGSLVLAGARKDAIKIHINGAGDSGPSEVNMHAGDMIERNRGNTFLTDSMWVQYDISEHLARLSGAFGKADDVRQLHDARVEKSAVADGSSLSLKARLGQIGISADSNEVK